MKRLPLLAALLCAVASPAFASDADLDALLQKESPAFFRYLPSQGAMVGAPAADMGGAYLDRAERFDVETIIAERAQAKAFHAALAALTNDSLTPKAQDMRDTVASMVSGIEGAPGIAYGAPDTWFGHLPYIVNQLNGPAVDIAKTMQTQQKVNSVDDANAYIRKLQELGHAIQSAQMKMTADANLGVHMPAALYRATISYLEGFIAPKPLEHPLVVEFDRKLRAVPGLPALERQRLVNRAALRVEISVYPAYAALLAETKRQALTPAKGDGIWAQPGGDAFYAWLVAFEGDTDMSPDQIHELGLKEVARIEKEMLPLLKKAKLKKGTVGERLRQLGNDPKERFPNTDSGRAQLLAYVNGEIAAVMKKVPDWFGKIPTQSVEVRRIPVATQDSTGANYTNPSLDGTTPGIYWINLKDTADSPKFTLKSLTFHEAVPGHHFQCALNMDLDLPFMLKIGVGFNAYAEGWALYAERLGKEMGMYKSDPRGDLGRLQGELYRAVRLVVDTGIHSKHWTREQAIDYMAAKTGSPDAEVTREIERYMTWPGQALGYKIGMIKILDLREKARKALGKKFDIKKFHEVVLLGGGVPLSVLEKRVDRYIAETR